MKAFFSAVPQCLYAPPLRRIIPAPDDVFVQVSATEASAEQYVRHPRIGARPRVRAVACAKRRCVFPARCNAQWWGRCGEVEAGGWQGKGTFSAPCPKSASAARSCANQTGNRMSYSTASDDIEIVVRSWGSGEGGEGGSAQRVGSGTLSPRNGRPVVLSMNEFLRGDRRSAAAYAPRVGDRLEPTRQVVRQCHGACTLVDVPRLCMVCRYVNRSNPE